jgi:hypothetical protein
MYFDPKKLVVPFYRDLNSKPGIDSNVSIKLTVSKCNTFDLSKLKADTGIME